MLSAAIVGFKLGRNPLLASDRTVVTMLRQFHERMTMQIFACGGIVEKYIGDSVFAVQLWRGGRR